MKYIANILTDKKFSDNELYNVVSTKEELIDGIPTLSVGWEFTKSMYPDVNIIEWQINEDTYWTYGKREHRDRYEENIKKFRELATNRISKMIGYVFFSMLVTTDGDKHALFDMFKKSPTTIYINNDMVYSFSEGNDKVIAFSLKDIDYECKDRKKIFSYFYKSNSINIVDGTTLSWEIKNSLRNCIYIIPYLCSN